MLRGVVVGVAATLSLLTGAGVAAAGGVPQQQLYGPFSTLDACNEQRAGMYDTQPCFFTDPPGFRREGWYFYAPLQPI